MTISLRSHDEFLAAIPHMFGFKPEESIVIYPLNPGLPRIRVDLPTSATARQDAWDSIKVPVTLGARPDSLVAIFCMTTDRGNAEVASNELRARLASVGVDCPLRLWATDEAWIDLDNGERGRRTEAARARVAAQMVAIGVVQPASSRQAMASSLEGDRTPIAAQLPAARTATTGSSPTAERTWAIGRLHHFHENGERLTVADVARMLVAVESIPIRDELWSDMTRRNAQSHVALWTDLTRRAPDEVRDAPATLLSFASWLNGDGAKAWCALDQVPHLDSYPLAGLMSKALTLGVNPSTWNDAETHGSNPNAAGVAGPEQSSDPGVERDKPRL